MKTSRLVMGTVLVVAIGLVMAPSPATAQDPNPDGRLSELKRVDPSRHGGKASNDVDFAAARADAHAKANNRQDADIDVKNKLRQEQSALGLGIGGSSSAEVKNKSTNVNVNTLKTGDVLNFNVNENQQVQSFGLPSHRGIEPKLR
jgi:hypothetical protein